MIAYSLFLLGITFGTTGMCYLYFRARRTVVFEVMLGTVMATVGWIMAAIGGVFVLFS